MEEKTPAITEKSANTDITHQEFDNSLTVTKGIRNGIMAVMFITVVVAVIFTSLVLVGWGRDRMEREVTAYNGYLVDWTNTQLAILNMFVDSIAANPSVLDDYDFAVQYLDKIVENYPEISAAYIARPGTEHEMTMNNGWVPDEDYIVSERRWYVDTINSDTGTSISAPYLDARTGHYCVTFSRIVRDRDTGAQIGVFALDFYTGNIINIMESSYSGNGYAFLVDNNNTIVNHPNADYKISEEKGTNIADTEYAKILDNSKIHFIKDYDGRFKVGISRTEDKTGFTVVSIKDGYTIYGYVFITGLVFIVLLITCIVLLYKLIIKMVWWQSEARKALREEAERASRADRAKSSFLARMSHEIRTPINAVLGMNEMILRESHEEQTLEYASNAYNAGKALLSIINDILDISKIEAGKLEIVNAEYDMYSLISDCYNMTADRAKKKGLNFTYSVDERIPARLTGDMFHIRQIVVNFITNAIKYTDEGTVKLEFAGIKEDDGFSLQISVHDTGIGLTEESQRKLFESFQRFDLKRNQTVEGTGLGLSICKQLAELMGGRVFVQSEYGKGSTFGCILPQTVTDYIPIGNVVINHGPGVENDAEGKIFVAESAHILVVDDVEMNITVFKSILKDHRLNIDSALSGRQCLEMVAKQKYDVIFMDHMMPEMDGMETYARMKETDHLNNDTPVVMLTANAILGEREKYMNAGFASYLTKPIMSEKLNAALLEYLPAEKVSWEEIQISDKSTSKASAWLSQSNSGGVDTKIIDAELGLSYSGQNEQAYFSIVENYLKKGAENIEKLNSFVETENWTDYVISVHALKSTSLTIGASVLSKAAEELEAAGKAENYELIKDKNETLIELYKEVLDTGETMLKRYKEETSDGEGDNASDDTADIQLEEIPADKLPEIRERIRKALVAFDDEEIASIFDEISAYTYNGERLTEKLAKVKELSEDFEYKDAEKLSGQIFDEMG